MTCPITCSLSAADAAARAARWRTLADTALVSAERSAAEPSRPTATPRAWSGSSPSRRARGRLLPFLDFALSRDGDRVVLRVSGPDEAAGIVALFAPPAAP